MEDPPLLRPRLLEHYVSREFLKIFLLSLTAFLTLYLVVDFFEKIDQLVRANLGLAEMGHYLLLKIPVALEQVLSPAVLLGAMLTFGLFDPHPGDHGHQNQRPGHPPSYSAGALSGCPGGWGAFDPEHLPDSLEPV